MEHEREIINLIHFIMYLPLVFVCKNIALFGVGLFVLMQCIGINLLVHSLLEGNLSQAVKTPLAILLPFLFLLQLRDRPVYFRRKEYVGFKYYLLVIDTELKYVVGAYLLSLIINIYFNPLSGLLNYTIISSIAALFVSIPFCKNMNKDAKQESQRG